MSKDLSIVRERGEGLQTKTVIFSSTSGFSFAQSLSINERCKRESNKPKEGCYERGDPIVDIKTGFSIREAIVESSKV
jgi:hypothetical protein